MSRLTLDFEAGHDDQLLADQDVGVVAPVSDAVYTGTGRLFLRWADPALSHRLDLVAEAGGTTYGPGVTGNDLDLRLSGNYRRRFSHHLAVETAATAWRFRRGSPSVFDLDFYRGGLRLGWSPAARWLVSVGGQVNRTRFIERPVGPAGDPERQDQTDAIGGLLYSLGRNSYLGAEVNLRRTGSNQPISRYSGPLVTVRSGMPLPLGVDLSAYGLYSHRDYDRPAVYVDPVTAAADTFGSRTDDAWQLGMTLERRIARRVAVFTEGTLLRQHSSAPGFGFDQARLSVGLSLDFLSPRPRSRVGELARPAPSPLAPRLTAEGMRFRYRAPGAGRVALVGGFNGWNPGRTPLAGPDGDGIWEVTLPVEAGTWRYAFVVDGDWKTPPDAPRYEDDGFGGTNGVLEVPASEAGTDVTGGPAGRQSD